MCGCWVGVGWGVGVGVRAVDERLWSSECRYNTGDITFIKISLVGFYNRHGQCSDRVILRKKFPDAINS